MITLAMFAAPPEGMGNQTSSNSCPNNSIYSPRYGCVEQAPPANNYQPKPLLPRSLDSTIKQNNGLSLRGNQSR
jgi:hypothetical protein